MFMKYQDMYNDGVQGKLHRYPLGAGSLCTDQGSMEVLASHAPLMLDASATTTVIGTSRDSADSAAPPEGQSAKANRNSETLLPELSRCLT